MAAEHAKREEGRLRELQLSREADQLNWRNSLQDDERYQHARVVMAPRITKAAYLDVQYGKANLKMLLVMRPTQAVMNLLLSIVRRLATGSVAGGQTSRSEVSAKDGFQITLIGNPLPQRAACCICGFYPPL